MFLVRQILFHEQQLRLDSKSYVPWINFLLVLQKAHILGLEVVCGITWVFFVKLLHIKVCIYKLKCFLS